MDRIDKTKNQSTRGSNLGRKSLLICKSEYWTRNRAYVAITLTLILGSCLVKRVIGLRMVLAQYVA